jgi:hypothetical protein
MLDKDYWLLLRHAMLHQVLEHTPDGFLSALRRLLHQLCAKLLCLLLRHALVHLVIEHAPGSPLFPRPQLLLQMCANPLCLCCGMSRCNRSLSTPLVALGLLDLSCCSEAISI